jgi:hypothetical protein
LPSLSETPLSIHRPAFQLSTGAAKFDPLQSLST